MRAFLAIFKIFHKSITKSEINNLQIIISYKNYWQRKFPFYVAIHKFNMKCIEETKPVMYVCLLIDKVKLQVDL